MFGARKRARYGNDLAMGHSDLEIPTLPLKRSGVPLRVRNASL